ncbi:MAG: SH3 domain-containing protein [Pseudomonadota bacterium]
MRILLMSLIVFLCMQSYSLATEPFKVPLADEAARAPGFEIFREALLRAVIARDIDEIIDRSNPFIHLDFGGGEGHDLLRTRLSHAVEPSNAGSSISDIEMSEELWLGLETALRFGGVVRDNGREFSAPYTQGIDLPSDYHAYFAAYIPASDVLVRDRPNRFGAPIDALGQHVVQIIDQGHGTSYAKIDLGADRTGWVHKDFLIWFTGYRAIFRFEDGSWSMTHLIAGD